MFVGDVTMFVADVTRFVGDVARFVGDVARFVADVARFVADVTRFVADVMRFVADARAELVPIMCISQHYKITDFLKINLKMIQLAVVTNITIINTTYRQYSCTHVPYQENGKCMYPAN
jgi:hypothetical protein